jgi:DNA-binding NtrC family response regulator
MSSGVTQRKVSIKLLMVDDETGFVDTVAKRLKLRDIVATKTYSGTEAVQCMRGNSFDVALLDLKMANLDGFETLKIMKTLDPQMPVIMLSGHGSDEAVQEALALGAHTFLTKPYELEALVEKIKQAAGKKG